MEHILLDTTLQPLDLVGGKGHSLLRLKAEGLPVPRFLIITTTAFRWFFTDTAEGREIYNDAYRVLVNKLHALDHFEVIRRKVASLPCPPPLLSALNQQLALIGLQGTPLAVRSSAVVEDGATESLAGRFESSLHVHQESLGRAIMKTWASFFTPSALFHGMQVEHLEQGIAVVVQQMVDATAGGVCFTTDPSGFRPGVIVVECYQGGPSALVSGVARPSTYEWQPGTVEGAWVEGAPLCSPSTMHLLAGYARRLEALYGCPQDVEWAAQGEQVWLLQARPVTALPPQEEPLTRLRWVLAEDATPDSFPLRAASAIHRKAARKKTPMRQFAHAHQIRVPVWVFLEYSRSSLEGPEFEAFLAQFDTPQLYIDVNPNLQALSISRDGLKEKLRQLLEAARTSNLTVRVREAPLTDIAVVVSGAAGGLIHLEYAAGGMMGLKGGLIEASDLLVSPDGEILQSHQPVQGERYSWDDRSGGWVRKPFHRTVSLPPEILRYLCDTYRLTERAKPGVKMEWWVEGDRCYLTDLFWESNEVRIRESANHRVLAPGEVTGRAVRVRNTAELEYLSMGYAVSVGSQEYGVTEVAELKEIITRLQAWPEPGILVAERPYVSLGPLLDFCGGVIVESGPALSHLAIMARERGKPLLAVGDLFHSLEEGQLVTLSDDGTLQIIEKTGKPD